MSTRWPAPGPGSSIPQDLPGLANAQSMRWCSAAASTPHRPYDGILIKENHIAAAAASARPSPTRRRSGRVPLMTEAEDLDEARAGAAADVDLLAGRRFPLELAARR